MKSGYSYFSYIDSYLLNMKDVLSLVLCMLICFDLSIKKNGASNSHTHFVNFLYMFAL